MCHQHQTPEHVRTVLAQAGRTVMRGRCPVGGHEVSAADAEIMAMYGELDDARKQQILDYQQELADAELARQHVQGSPRG